MATTWTKPVSRKILISGGEYVVTLGNVTVSLRKAGGRTFESVPYSELVDKLLRR